MATQYLPDQLRLNIKDSIQKEHFKKALKDLLLKYNVESDDLLEPNAYKDKNIRCPKTGNCHRKKYKIVTASDSIEFGVNSAILRDTKLRSQSKRAGSFTRRAEHNTADNKVLELTIQSVSAQTTRKRAVSAKRRPKTALAAKTSPPRVTLSIPPKSKAGIVDSKVPKIKPSTPPKKSKLTRPITVQALTQITQFPEPLKRTAEQKRRSLDRQLDNARNNKATRFVISKQIPVPKSIRNESAMKNKSSTKVEQPNKKRRKVSVGNSTPVDTETATPIIPPPNSLQSETFSQPTCKYPILSDQTFIKKFLGVTITNNQKGRIRQVLKEVFSGVNVVHLPDVIHNKILSILNSSENLTDADLRKIRVLYNMLKIAVDAKKSDTTNKTTKVSGKTKQNDTDVEKHISQNKHLVKVERRPKMDRTPKRDTSPKGDTSPNRESPNRDVNSTETLKKGKEINKKNDVEQKVKGQKRYVVFVGNLPPNIDKEQILQHFSDLRHVIKDVRIPVQGSEKKSAIAYVELSDQASFEMALSKHHSMLGNKRINVLYTTQKNTKISKAEAKATTAKLVAMVKSGQLAGSVPKKRSQRRAKQRHFLKLQEQSQLTNNK